MRLTSSVEMWTGELTGDNTLTGISAPQEIVFSLEAKVGYPRM